MKSFVAALLILLMLIAVESSHAGVFERDWLALGDGLLTFDDVNRREWLDLSETQLAKFPGFTLEDRYQSVVAELAPGGQFAGFTVANLVDAEAFAASAGIDLSTFDFDTNQAASLRLIELLGLPVERPGTFGNLIAIGYLDEIGFFGRRVAMVPQYAPPWRLSNGSAGLLTTDSDGLSTTSTGVALYRDVIPEPSTVVLTVMCLLGVWMLPALFRHRERAGKWQAGASWLPFIDGARDGLAILRRMSSSNSRCSSRGHRRLLRIEQCEDRRVLSATTDVVFLFDESMSSDAAAYRTWLQEVVPALQAKFEEPANDISARYGLIGYADISPATVPDGFGHSQKVNGTLFSDVGSAGADQFVGAVGGLHESNGSEDGWDAIEHAIAEYDIRDGAVPTFILVQSGEGRNPLNNALTHDGIRAALKSKNTILNSVVPAPFDTAIAPVVYGVESPEEDGDGQPDTHTAYIDQAGGTGYETTTFDDDLHDINGTTSGGNTDDDYVRLAWETGGAVWNVGVLSTDFNVQTGELGGIVDVLTQAFVDSVVAQIEQASLAGLVHRELAPVLQMNLGGPQQGEYLADSTAENNFFASSAIVTADAGLTINTASNSIPDNAAAEIFRTARTFDQDILQIRGGDTGFTAGFEGAVASNKSILFTPLGTAANPGYEATVLATPEFEDISGPLTPSLFANGPLFPPPNDIIFAARPHVDQFEVPFYGINYDRMYVSVDGLITFETANPANNNSELGSPPLELPTLAVLWNDVDLRSTGEVFWDVFDLGTSDERVVVQWDDVAYSQAISPKTITFQAIIYGDGRIQLNYSDLSSTSTDQHEGAMATVGIASRAGNLSFDETVVPNGSYVVEMFFAEIDGGITNQGQRRFDVLLEGTTMLSEYDIWNDFAKILVGPIENTSVQAGFGTAIVKRFAVDVTDGNGLQIELQATSSAPPLLSGLRVLAADPPRVTNVTISNSVSGGQTYSFAEVLAAHPDSGRQLLAVPVYEASAITIRFSQPMDVDEDFPDSFHLTALSTIAAAPTYTDFEYNPETFEATWSFDLVNLPTAVQFLLTLDDSITDLAGMRLDGEWINPVSITTTNGLQSEFPSGDGTPGGTFKFVFTSILPNAGVTGLNNVTNEELNALLDSWGDVVTPFSGGDFDGDGQVGNSDLSMLLDTWGIDLRDLLILRDVTGDRIVDQDDLDQAADLNGDGVTNQQDVNLINQQLGLDLADSIVS